MVVKGNSGTGSSVEWPGSDFTRPNSARASSAAAGALYHFEAPRQEDALEYSGERLPAHAWIFGYGSLIFRPGFGAAEVVVAELVNHARRFWQGSPDHRGTPAAPGRVVTLVAAPGERCLGRAYRLPEGRAEEILAMLDQREQAGFERLEVELHSDRGRLDAITYVAASDNPHFLGPAPLEVLAAEIAVRHGPSGSNADYVRQLASALRELGAPSDHVFEVEQQLDALAQGPPDRTT